MNAIRRLCLISSPSGIYRNFSVSTTNYAEHSCKVLVVGGGSGGCTMAAKFSRKLKKDEVIVLEPSPDHYYQPLWTLVGAGVKTVAQTHCLAQDVLPAKAKWVKDKAISIDPRSQKVVTECGDVINYEYIIIAVGLNNDFNKVPGLTEALQWKGSGVSTIYSPVHCATTWDNIRDFKGGEAIFTFPDTPIKCPGAPQKIAYLADSHFNRSGVRSKTRMQFNTSLPVIFGVKKYADALLKVVERKKIQVNYNLVLSRIFPDRKEAVFVSSADRSKETTMKYDLLHVGPPLRVPSFLAATPDITDHAGFLTVDKFTLQHTKYPTMFGIGDCIDTPNSKTAAAIAKQCYVLEHNLLKLMEQNDRPDARYDGYGACPLITSYNTCILAEFLYDGVVHETMPFDQVHMSAESRLSYYMKKELFPFIYWHLMLKGYYHGPEVIRNIINPFAK